MYIKTIIISLIIIVSYVYGNAPSISIESKYGEGSLMNAPTNEGAGDYYYNEHIMDINFNFDYGLYFYGQLEYSRPPLKGFDFVGMNNYHLDILLFLFPFIF